MDREHDEDGIALVDSLSPRERQLLEMARNGLTDQAIANELGISLATVSTYWGRIRIKYGPLGRTEIVARYLRALMDRATTELRANESRMRTVLEALPVGVFLTDAEGKPVYVNDAYGRIVGDGDHLARLVREGDGNATERSLTHADGSVVWVRIHADTWHDEGRVAGQVGVVEDVTQEREARERASEAEERYRLLFALAPEAIVSVDESLNVTGFNASATRMFGYALEEIIGRPLAVLLPDRFRSGHAALVRGFGQGSVAAARPMAARSEVRGLRRDGTEFPCEASIVRQILNGRPHYTAIVRDVSDRVRTVSGDPLDAVPFPTWRLNAEGGVVDGNDALRSYAGIVHGDRTDPVHPDDAPLVATALDQGVAVDLRARVRRGDGTYRWHRLRFQPDNGGGLVFATDTHDLESAAEELRKVRAILGG